MDASQPPRSRPRRTESPAASGVFCFKPCSTRSRRVARPRATHGSRSELELQHAGHGAYDHAIAHDITHPVPLDETFDVVLSWQVLAHVKPLDIALEYTRSVLRPHGMMLAQLSGALSVFALLSRVVPHRARVWAMARYLGHPEEAKFPTYYDHCTARALQRIPTPWTSITLHPFHRGAGYFGMSRPLQRAYLGYESTVARLNLRNLATHYLLGAPLAKAARLATLVPGG